MTLGTAAEEIKWSDGIWGSTDIKALRDQQEEDFGYWGPYEFKMPAKEGAWENVTTPASRILANKVIGLLSSSWMQLFIDVADEVKKERKQISNTEQLANGCIWVADREATKVPSGKPIQAALASLAVLRGGIAESVYWWTPKGKDGKDKAPVCDLRTYDPMYCQWEEGDNELLKFCSRSYVTKRYLERNFKKTKEAGFNFGKADKSTDKVLAYTFWDENEWRVAIEGNPDWITDSKEGYHGLGYVPVYIRSCGAVPYLRSEEWTDGTMKWSWQSYAMNTRKLYEVASKLLSIAYSNAIESGRRTAIGVYDSLKSGNQPPDLAKVGYGVEQRNKFVFLDTAKGQDFKGFAEAPDSRVVDSYYAIIQGLDVLAGIDPIAQGVMNRSGSGALAAELRSAALEFINPFRECVEGSLVWAAEECVKQFINGDYEKVSVEGRSRTKQKFNIDLTPKDVEEKHFDCNLVADRLRDQSMELGQAIQEVSTGLSSRKTAMVKHNLHADPDREMDNMAEELASQDPVFRFDKLALYFHDKGDERMAQYYQALSKIEIEKTIMQAGMAGMMPPETPTGAEATKKPLTPQARVAQIQTEPQQISEVGQ